MKKAVLFPLILICVETVASARDIGPLEDLVEVLDASYGSYKIFRDKLIRLERAEECFIVSDRKAIEMLGKDWRSVLAQQGMTAAQAALFLDSLFKKELFNERDSFGGDLGIEAMEVHHSLAFTGHHPDDRKERGQFVASSPSIWANALRFIR